MAFNTARKDRRTAEETAAIRWRIRETKALGEWVYLGNRTRKDLADEYGVSHWEIRRLEWEATLQDQEQNRLADPNEKAHLAEKRAELADRSRRLALKSEASKNYQASVNATRLEAEIERVIGAASITVNTVNQYHDGQGRPLPAVAAVLERVARAIATMPDPASREHMLKALREQQTQLIDVPAEEPEE